MALSQLFAMLYQNSSSFIPFKIRKSIRAMKSNAVHCVVADSRHHRAIIMTCRQMKCQGFPILHACGIKFVRIPSHNGGKLTGNDNNNLFNGE
jgi:hypothetical protein